MASSLDLGKDASKMSTGAESKDLLSAITFEAQSRSTEEYLVQ